MPLDNNLVLTRGQRHAAIFAAGSLERLFDQPGGRQILEAEARDPTGLITPDGLAYLQVLREERRQAGTRMALFFSTDDVIVVPGLMGSTLRDVQGDLGLIWIDPALALDDGRELDALRLAAFDADHPERDDDARVRIESPGAVPPVYDLLRADLELRRYAVQIFPFDWRKNIEEGAQRLANLIRSRLAQRPRPLHVVAHSQGSLVARRALQLVGAETARRLVRNLVLLGPASFGTLAAAFAIAGSHETIETVKRLGVTLPEDFTQVLQSFTGLYQLLPWKQGTLAEGFDPQKLAAQAFWKSGVDPNRLEFGFEWGAKIDTAFFADRTTIV